MKRAILVVAALVAARAAAEEKGPEPEVVVSGNVEHGGYGGPEMRISSVRGEGAVFVGGRGGWIIDHRFVIGGAGYGLASRIGAPDAAQPATGRYDINFGYGGPFIEAIILPRRLWHLSLTSLFAAGGVSYAEHGVQNPGTLSTSTVFVWEPSATLELNVVKFMRVDLGVGWRLVRGVDLTALKNTDVGGFSGVLAFKFGKF
ncbi:MAG: hypothetical protein ACXWLM_10345 [Myxococcales bacterium]